MRIALDATYSIGNRLSGVGVYSHEILHGLAAFRPDIRFRLYYRPDRYARALGHRTRSNCSRHLLWENWAARSVDLFHGLNQRMPSARWRRRVATFHDLFVLTSDYSTEEFRRRFALQARRAADRSDLIIAVSEFTANQVHTLLGVERSRIRVVPHGVHAYEDQPATQRRNVVLHVGAIQRRKNTTRLVEAFERCPAGWRLALAGSAGFDAEETLERITNSPRRADIDVMGYVSAELLGNLYRQAKILAFPSLDEGFGIPVLEAMARGVPVLTSNRSALREVAGDAAVLVDPFEVESIREGLHRLMTDEGLRERQRKLGFERAARFQWKHAVQRTWKVYEELLG